MTNFAEKIKLMRIHREGFVSLALVFGFGLLLVLFARLWLPNILPAAASLAVILFLVVLQFFRSPSRHIPQKDNNLIYAPADGKVVVVEETVETEFFKDKRLMISIFMSPVNVHVNWSPIRGEVRYAKYHPGKYLVAWHPKSSTENERHTVVIGQQGGDILVRQIAGALARRIVNYLNPGQNIEQGGELGFIKFGSRVDIFLPLHAKPTVNIGEVVKGTQTVIARW
jgi:phosphatidylserine decarboxylase